MNALIPVSALPPGALTAQEIDATMAYAKAEKAVSTRVAYAADWGRTSAPIACPGAPQPCQRTRGSLPPMCLTSRAAG